MRGSTVTSLLVAAAPAFATPTRGGERSLPENYLFIFGDSYTTTGFNYTIDPQPSLQYPLGNPAYPGATFDGRNAANTSNNENWVGFLTYNNSLPSTVTYNYAVGGNVINITALNDTWTKPTTIDFVQQEAQWETLDSSVPWNGDNSVVLTWFGINDVSLFVFGGSFSHPSADAKTLFPADVDSYYNILSRMYNKGARKFVTILTPPIWRAPESGYGENGHGEIYNLTALFNGLVQDGHQTWTDAHPDANAVVYDPTDLFNTILDNPSAYNISSVTCVSYPYGQPCAWTDFIHTGVVIQDEIAKQIAPVVKKLQSGSAF